MVVQLLIPLNTISLSVSLSPLSLSQQNIAITPIKVYMFYWGRIDLHPLDLRV